jgi:uncharacterized protein GlcG (DUF336 family)
MRPLTRSTLMPPRCRTVALLSKGCTEKPTVNLETARRVIEAAEAKAKTIGCPMNIAVVDVGGNLVAHARMDNARTGAIDIAINNGRVMILAGGAPLRDADQIIGAIGVSGGSDEQDSACARAGVEALSAPPKLTNNDPTKPRPERRCDAFAKHSWLHPREEDG